MIMDFVEWCEFTESMKDIRSGQFSQLLHLYFVILKRLLPRPAYKMVEGSTIKSLKNL